MSTRCPRCHARCVVATREEILCLACGETIKEAFSLMSSSNWTPTLPDHPVAVDRGRHFNNDNDDEEIFAR